MRVYAGIDEAGYGPLFGPLVVGRTVFGLPDDAAPPGAPADLWKLLRPAVCRAVADRRGRIPVNDSKKLHGRTGRRRRQANPAPSPATSVLQGPTAGVAPTSAPAALTLAEVRYLELGALMFAQLAGHHPQRVDHWLDRLGEATHHDLRALPWYAPAEDAPWQTLPCTWTDGELAIARSLLANAARGAGVQVLDLGAAVVFEDRFNRMVAATRSKAAMSFTFVAGHLKTIWDRHAPQHPCVVVDRQSGRTHYRELLALTIPEARLRIVEEDARRSAYVLEADGPAPRRMTVSFEVQAEDRHLPVALASMISKYTRELLMSRFQAWFLRRAPQVKPTAGYALDAQRFWREIEPLLPSLGVTPDQLRRAS